MVIVAMGALVACGRDEPPSSRAAARVPDDFVPTSLVGGKYSAAEDRQSRKKFGNLTEQALVADGRLWAIRAGVTDKLVATLQVATMEPKVDLTDADQRTAIANEVVTGAHEQVTVGDVEVIQVTNEDQSIYVWFGREMFEVLLVKPSRQDPVDVDALLREIIDYQTSHPGWKGLSDATSSGSGRG